MASQRVDTPLDDPAGLTVHALGRRKNETFLQMLDDGVAPFPGAPQILDWRGAQGIPVAVVSSSQNAEAVLRAAGLRSKVDLVIDGVVALRKGLAGKPQPDTYPHAARQLGVSPARTIVVEDACSGVAPGHAGGFWVVGIDWGAGRKELLDNGAGVVVDELDELFANYRASTSPTPSSARSLSDGRQRLLKPPSRAPSTVGPRPDARTVGPLTSRMLPHNRCHGR